MRGALGLGSLHSDGRGAGGWGWRMGQGTSLGALSSGLDSGCCHLWRVTGGKWRARGLQPCVGGKAGGKRCGPVVLLCLCQPSLLGLRVPRQKSEGPFTVFFENPRFLKGSFSPGNSVTSSEYVLMWIQRYHSVSWKKRVIFFSAA